MARTAPSGPRKRGRPKFKLGAPVVASVDARVLTDVGPFTALVVTRVHKDGTLDLSTTDGAREWTRIPAEEVCDA